MQEAATFLMQNHVTYFSTKAGRPASEVNAQMHIRHAARLGFQYFIPKTTNRF